MSAGSKIEASDGYVVNDGTLVLGMIKQHGKSFEVYADRDGELAYLAKVESRSEAVRLLRDASSGKTCARPPS